MTSAEILGVHSLSQHFAARPRLLRRADPVVRAVEDVSFSIHAGETLGLVGESGCGKSTVARTILRLLEPTAGRIVFEGADITTLPKSAMRRLRGRMQIVFQDPFSSLDPKMTVRDIVAEPLRLHARFGPEGGYNRVGELLATVGIDPARGLDRPRAFSGGQQQRIGIARALALQPRLLILDEPVSALDVSIQAQVVNLLQDLQEQFGLAYLFVAHNLAVVKHIAHRVAVMYLGRIIEIGDKAEVFASPSHPYTKALLSAVPDPDAPATRIVLRGEIPSPASPPSGCGFRTRCWKAQPLCAAEVPQLEPRGAGTQHSACHFPEPPPC